MLRLIERIGDGLLKRVVPTVTARAETCSFAYIACERLTGGCSCSNCEVKCFHCPGGVVCIKSGRCCQY